MALSAELILKVWEPGAKEKARQLRRALKLHTRYCASCQAKPEHCLPETQGRQGCEGALGLSVGSWSLPSDNQAPTQTSKGVTKAGNVTGTSHFTRTFNGSVGQGGKP